MTMNNYKVGKTLALAVLLFSGYLSNAVAQHHEPLLNFKFNHLSNIQNAEQVFQVSPSASNQALKFAQFDATWTYRTYPGETKNVNIDLGVTLRHIYGFKNSTESTGNSYFQEVLPLLHASALYSLPLQGLSAGIEGSHLDSNTHQVFDFRAKVSYEWRKGFGLQGGWQHQQFNLDNASDVGRDYEQNGPFIDFYLNF